MSLKEAYSLAHSAECRLSMEANRPERNLRFVVGHLMHYESLRLRIVEIEHDISKSSRAQSVAFKGTGRWSPDAGEVRKKPSTGQLGGGRRKSPPPSNKPIPYDPEQDDEIDDDDPWSGGSDSGGEEENLGLQRFPSGSARAPQPPPDLMPDDDDHDDYDDDPESPEEPDQAMVQELIQGEGREDLANLYEGVRKCPCHRHKDAPSFEKMWELPEQEQKKEGVTRAVAQVFV
ncbi:hypothetical protein LTR37_004866 [Vermiconidia calcicola]|uniref:Uncharacterized protein n=1 Tax=Vermiconidia calcicola TaxID=1690605 RepID=A0ACC3NKY6_9PEZI|nr:hypothetical protein LTR37_004866 [Vermiconidia calcicola]